MKSVQMKFTRVIILLILCTSICYAADTTTNKIIKNIYKEYKPTNEMGGCMKARIDNTTLKISSWYQSNYGTETFVKFKCPGRYTTMFHTHPPFDTECQFSEYDINFFKNQHSFRISVLFCDGNKYRYMYRSTAYIYSDIIYSDLYYN